MQTIKIVASVTLAVIVIALLLMRSAKADAEMMQTADCVAKTATYQGYAGNVHSQEAWDLFVGECV